MTPAEAVEAAAIVLWDKEMNAPWSSAADGFKAPFLRDARQALEAAAPYMAAGLAESRVVEDGVELFRFTSSQREWLRGGSK